MPLHDCIAYMLGWMVILHDWNFPRNLFLPATNSLGVYQNRIVHSWMCLRLYATSKNVYR